MKKQIPWKFLPIVIALLFLPAIPAIMMRHNTREAAQAAVQTTRVDETELRQLIVDSMVQGGFTTADGQCVATSLINFHGAEKLARLMRAGDTEGMYGPVEANMKAVCGIERTH